MARSNFCPATHLQGISELSWPLVICDGMCRINKQIASNQAQSQSLKSIPKLFIPNPNIPTSKHTLHGAWLPTWEYYGESVSPYNIQWIFSLAWEISKQSNQNINAWIHLHRPFTNRLENSAPTYSAKCYPVTHILMIESTYFECKEHSGHCWKREFEGRIIFLVAETSILPMKLSPKPVGSPFFLPTSVMPFLWCHQISHSPTFLWIVTCQLSHSFPPASTQPLLGSSGTKFSSCSWMQRKSGLKVSRHSSSPATRPEAVLPRWMGWWEVVLWFTGDSSQNGIMVCCVFLGYQVVSSRIHLPILIAIRLSIRTHMCKGIISLVHREVIYVVSHGFMRGSRSEEPQKGTPQIPVYISIINPAPN